MGFIIHFYIIFGTKLLTQGLVQIAVFAYFSVSQKRNIKRSPNGMKPSGEIFLERYLHGRLENHIIGHTWRPRGWGARPLPLGAPLPHGLHVAPPVPFFLLYIPTYPENIRTTEKTLVPPSQPSVPVRSHLGACSGAPPEGGSSTECFYINTIASP